MAKYLVIVESPAKAKPIEKYLGAGFKVTASVGHVKDLPEKSLGVDVEKDFTPRYEVIKGKTKILKDIKKLAKGATEVYLAMDPDREGEAIAFHLAEEIDDPKKIHRILFNEITKKAILKAFEVPLELDRNKYNSQKARRILDRLVGYQISPLLWEKVQRGLSAGRVQSVAVRIVVEREKEILAFVTREYWSVEGLFDVNQKQLKAKLNKINGEKPEITNNEQADKILEECKKAKPKINEIEKTSRQRNAPPPFITSTLQQEAARKFRYTAKKTMMFAQQLYEGIDIGGDATGLITYMRTDSTRISESAIEEVRTLIKNKFGPEYLPEKPKLYKPKREGQDAHEAIRPTRFDLPPEACQDYLDKDQLKLYTLIWNRYIACQMESAKFDQTTIDIGLDKYTFRAVGNIMTFPGFTKIYTESLDTDNVKDDKEDENLLPQVEKGDKIDLKELMPNQHFTQPPPRYTEATLIKELEEKGIGRPSTFATILSTILDKNYATKDGNYLRPTELGTVVTELLVESFPQVLNIAFTAGLENDLDDIEDGKKDWVKTLHNFYGEFEKFLKTAKKEMRNLKREETPTDIKCKTCSSPMKIKWGKNGQFLACSRYPDCTTTQEFKRNENNEIKVVEEIKAEERCPSCKSEMIIKNGRYGRFLACTQYPDCQTTLAFKIGIKCPVCKSELIEKKTKRGKLFYSCMTWPKCSFSTWDTPVNQPCPLCNFPILLKKTKKDGAKTYCHNKECSYTLEQ